MLSNVYRLAVCFLIAGFLSPTFADTPVKNLGLTTHITADDVKLRIDTFDEIDRVFKALRFKVVYQRSTNGEGSLEYSSKLVELSYRLPDLFDTLSSQESFPMSRSRPEIWSQKARFDLLMDKFVDNLEQIDDQIKSGELVKAGRLIDETAKGCRRCHNAYRYK